jgi:hypothetical protein
MPSPEGKTEMNDKLDMEQLLKLLQETGKLQESAEPCADPAFSYDDLEYENPFFSRYVYTESLDAPEEGAG